ncbi:hypothetical protein DYB34_007557 [Aphanomyces astaci]|uniref:Uncharacterized protein n=1 Tax=Aphanomyces astaci TaxID=112090 RepID=A0A3R6W355_APHAT|nr:hypothetical protein DYB34_007557 [Aphanomyces astaci]
MMAGVPRSSPPPLPPPPRGLIGNLGLLSYALMQLAGQAVDVTVITPCAELISTSVMNPNVNSNTLNGSSDKAHHIPVNGDDSMKKTRRHQSRKAALEASMLRKLGVREPMDEVEETLELPTDMTGVRGTANNELLSRAFESFDEGQEHEDQVARDDNGEEDGEQWHVEQTHPTLRRRHHRQRLHQALRNSPKVHARPRALSKQYRHLQRSRDEGTALQTMTPMDRYAIKVLSMVVVVFVAVVLLIVLLALYRVLLV